MKTRCPTCRGTAQKDGNKLYPFCSERCHAVDLGRWLLEDYRVPAEPADTGAGTNDGGSDPESER